MDTHSQPIKFGASQHGPASPSHTSNLTSALRSTTGNEVRPTPAMDIGIHNHKPSGNGFGHRDSAGSGYGSRHGSGAQPISMNREKPRRESLAGSMVQGMSFGGVSVGSFIRDDIIMQGTSPFAYQSPSFHSSSYMPKLEANFMRDFSCCGLTLASLHELLQHFEETHNQPYSSISKQNSTHIHDPPDSKAAIAAGAAAAVQEQAQRQQQQGGSVAARQSASSQQASASAAGGQRQASTQDMEAVQDMEMDEDQVDPLDDPSTHRYHPPRLGSAQYNSNSNRVPSLDLSMAQPVPHPGLRTSQPATPVSANRNRQTYNPTVSSVNTPTLSANPQQRYTTTPDTSQPGTPGEVGGDFSSNLADLNMGNQNFMQSQYSNFGNYGYPTGPEMLDLCIDEPAKRLYSINNGYGSSKQPPASQLGDDQYGEDSEIAKTIREQQRLAGVPEAPSDVPKPYHCPVIGCEKAYKNQNGLKYHKHHGHSSQKLSDNGNGTFSIVNPDTLVPYPGTLGMEKHKPYRCNVCGKRYKNLNGLKYHKSHNSMCDRGEASDGAGPAGTGNGSAGMGFGMGATGGGGAAGGVGGSNGGGGLPEIGEEMVM